MVFVNSRCQFAVGTGLALTSPNRNAHDEVPILEIRSMALNLDSALGFHAQSLRTHSKRAQLLSNNIANVDTPKYKARDIDFASVLQKADSRVSLKATRSGHFGGGSQVPLPEVERPALQRTPNGNTVDIHVEKAEFARSTMLYSASLTFLSSRINGLLTAIRGGS